MVMPWQWKVITALEPVTAHMNPLIPQPIQSGLLQQTAALCACWELKTCKLAYTRVPQLEWLVQPCCCCCCCLAQLLLPAIQCSMPHSQCNFHLFFVFYFCPHCWELDSIFYSQPNNPQLKNTMMGQCSWPSESKSCASLSDQLLWIVQPESTLSIWCSLWSQPLNHLACGAHVSCELRLCVLDGICTIPIFSN